MLLAEMPMWLAIAASIAVVVGFGVIALLMYRGYEFFARRALQRAYRDLEIAEAPSPDDVILKYHTYHGLLAWVTQTPHEVALPPEDARTLLGRLLRFNLSWGLLSCGCLFIPPIAIGNYMAQRRSIAEQEMEHEMPRPW